MSLSSLRIMKKSLITEYSVIFSDLVYNELGICTWTDSNMVRLLYFRLKQ